MASFMLGKDMTNTRMRGIILALLIGPGAFAQTAVFPPLSGEKADGTRVELPDRRSTGYTVIGLAYSQKAAPMLEAWAEPAFLRFVAKHGLFAGTYEADVWFVPMFVGGNKAAYAPSLKRFRESADPEVAEHVLFYQGDIERFERDLELNRRDIPYFFVIDAEGRVVHRTEGEFTVEKLDAIEERLME